MVVGKGETRVLFKKGNNGLKARYFSEQKNNLKVIWGTGNIGNQYFDFSTSII